TAQPPERGVGAEQVLRRHAAYREDEARCDERDLSIEKAATGLRFHGGRVAIARRAALQDVRDEYRITPEPDGAQHLVQQLPCPADERLAAAVLLRTRRLADDHPVGVAPADPEHRLGAGRVQGAARAARDRRLE